MCLSVIILGKFEGCVNKNSYKYRKIKTIIKGYQIILLISYILIALFGYWLKSLNLRHLRKYGDVVPEEFILSGSFETLKPIVRKIGSGTEMIWRLGTIKRGEERLLHYKIKPRGIVTGEHSLPSAHLTARKGANTITTISNHANIDMGTGPSRIRVKTE